MPRRKATPRGPNVNITGIASTIKEQSAGQPNLTGPGRSPEPFKPVTDITADDKKRIQEETDFYISRHSLNKLRAEANEWMFKSTEDSEGYLARQGMNAQGTSAEFTERFNQRALEIKEELFSREARKKFEQGQDSIMNHSRNMLDQHEKSEWKKFRDSTFQADIAGIVEDASSVTTDPIQVRQQMSLLGLKYDQYAKWQGLSPSAKLQMKKKGLNDAAKAVMDKNMKGLPEADDLKTASGADQALEALAVVDNIYEGDPGANNGIGGFLKAKEQANFDKDLLDRKREYQVIGLGLGFMEEVNPETGRNNYEALDDGASEADVVNRAIDKINQTNLYSPEDLKEPALSARQDGIRAEVIELVKKKVKERMANNNRIERENKANMTIKLNEAITDGKNSSVSSVYREFQKLPVAQRPDISYMTFENLKDMEKRNDADWPPDSHPDFLEEFSPLLALRDPDSFNAAMDMLYKEINKTEDRRVSLDDAIKFFSQLGRTGRTINREVEADERRAQVLPRSLRRTESRATGDIDKNFPELKGLWSPNPKNVQAIALHESKQKYPNLTDEELQAKPDFPFIYKRAAKAQAKTAIITAMNEMLKPQKFNENVMAEIIWANAPSKRSLSPKKIKENVLRWMRDGELASSRFDDLTENETVKKLNRLLKAGRITENEALRGYMKIWMDLKLDKL